MLSKRITYLQLENESESSDVTENFPASLIVMYYVPIGKFDVHDILNMFRITLGI